MLEKPLGIKSYGHIPHLPGSRLGPGDHKVNPGQAKICTQKAEKHHLIIVQEKLDGSNCAVAKINGEICPLTRNGYRAETTPYKQHHLFSKWAWNNRQRFLDLLEEGERAVGEWLIQAHGVKYKLPHDPFVIFDIMKGMERTPYEQFIQRIIAKPFIIPRLIHQGGPINIEKVEARLEPSGHGALEPVEGAVWRVETHNKRIHRVDFLAKWVHPDMESGKYLDPTGPDIWNCNKDGITWDKLIS